MAAPFTVDKQTVAALGPFMLRLSLAQPAMQLHFTLAGAFRGAGDTVMPSTPPSSATGCSASRSPSWRPTCGTCR
ncbi:MAG: hypothetical protein HY704_03965 [Gemmatimonadetes bacterium]|nr:hypothetical protein [Gemmatimonadota bacterium]